MWQKSELSLFFCNFDPSVSKGHFFCTVLKTTRWKKNIVQPQKLPDSPSDNNTTPLVWVSGLTEDGKKNCSILLVLYRINGESFPVVTPMMPSLFLARQYTCSWNKKGVDLCGEQQRLIPPPECWWPRGMTEWVVAAATALQCERVGGSEGNVNLKKKQNNNYNRSVVWQSFVCHQSCY